ITTSPYRYITRVRFQAAKSVMEQHFSPTTVTIEDDGPTTCVVVTGADNPKALVLHLAMPGIAFEILEPAEVADAARAMSAQLTAAVGR
ncbi:MAG: transcriptional regulator, partial [Mycolicibacterium aromaticivorans]|nr:transcriptional regulator [Mycolicibacterium aromaticivorans]